MATVSLLVTNYEDWEDAYLHARIEAYSAPVEFFHGKLKKWWADFYFKNVYSLVTVSC